MTLKTFLSALLITGSTASLAAVEHYIIDTKGSHASIQFRTQHLGYSWLTGRFNQFSGNFSFDADKPSANKITVDINVASIDSNHAERDKHLRDKKYLNTAEFPGAKFVSTSITPNNDGSYQVVGDFSLHGVTREISFTATEVGTGPDPWGGYRRGFTAQTTIRFADYGYSFNLGPATTSVELQLDLEGIRQ
jgi:polyisoprenoid-binding protein YceI